MSTSIEQYRSMLSEAEKARELRRSDLVWQYAGSVIESNSANALFSDEIDLSGGENDVTEAQAYSLLVYGLLRILVVDWTTYLKDQATLPRRALRTVRGGTRPPQEPRSAVNALRECLSNGQAEKLVPMTLGAQSISWPYEIKRDLAKLSGAQGNSIVQRYETASTLTELQQQVNHLPTSFGDSSMELSMQMRRSIGMRGILPLMWMEHALLQGQHPDHYQEAMAAWNNFICFIHNLPVSNETKHQQVNKGRPAWLKQKVREGLFPNIIRAEYILHKNPLASLPDLRA